MSTTQVPMLTKPDSKEAEWKSQSLDVDPATYRNVKVVCAMTGQKIREFADAAFRAAVKKHFQNISKEQKQ